MPGAGSTGAGSERGVVALKGVERGVAEAGAVAVVAIGGIAAGGDGVGRESSGRVVFAPRSAPGDRVRVELAETRKRWARGRVLEILEPGPGRRSPPCPLYEKCGGCQLQHLNRTDQVRAKRSLVEEALRRIGGLSVRVADTICAGDDLRYRNRITFSVETAGRPAAMGLRRLDAPGEVLDVDACLLAEAAIAAAWTSLREVWEREPAEAPGEGTKITVRGSADGDVDVTTSGGASPAAESVTRWLETVPRLVGWHHADGDGEPVCVAGSPTLSDRWQGIDFQLPAGVFLQVNRAVSAAMDEWLDERVGSVEGRRVLDLYSGVGARAIRWARQGADVACCEVSARAAATCREAADPLQGGLEVLAQRVEERIGRLLPADLAVVNPPRAGLSAFAAEALASAELAQLLYVSCDPATLARDLRRLGRGWALKEVQPFDAFPQTSHVETIAWLQRV